MPDKPAGWYRHPDDRRQHAYWDGDRWVEPQEAMPDTDAPGPDGPASETGEPEPGNESSCTETGSAS